MLLFDVVGYRLSWSQRRLSTHTLYAVLPDGTLKAPLSQTGCSRSSFDGLRAEMVQRGLLLDRQQRESSERDVPHVFKELTDTPH